MLNVFREFFDLTTYVNYVSKSLSNLESIYRYVCTNVYFTNSKPTLKHSETEAYN